MAGVTISHPAAQRARWVGRLLMALGVGLALWLGHGLVGSGARSLGADLASWCLALGLVLGGLGVARLRPLARRLIVAAAWLVSLYAALFVLVAVAVELRGEGILFSEPAYPPLRGLWLGLWLQLALHFVLLAGTLLVWWLLTRPDVRDLFAANPGAK